MQACSSWTMSGLSSSYSKKVEDMAWLCGQLRPTDGAKDF